MQTTIETRLCRGCQQTQVPERSRYCEECRRRKVREASVRFRAGITMAPGEESVGRSLAHCSLRDVATKFSVSVQRVQQIERIALLKLRRAMLPFLHEHDPAAHDRVKARETSGQTWAARTSVRRQLSAKQTQIIAQLKRLATEYENSGQTMTARAIRYEVEDLTFRLEQLFQKGQDT
jgi:hypothetical protein